MDESTFKQGIEDIYDVKSAINDQIRFALTICIGIIQERRSDDIERQLKKLKEQLASANDFSLSSFIFDIFLSFASAGISQVVKIGMMRLISKVAAPNKNFISLVKVTDFKYSFDAQFNYTPFPSGRVRDFNIKLRLTSTKTTAIGEIITLQSVIEKSKSGFLNLSNNEKEWLLDSLISTLDQSVNQLATQLKPSDSVKVNSNTIAGNIGEGLSFMQELIDVNEATFRLIIKLMEILKQNNVDIFALAIIQIFNFYKWAGESSESYIQILRTHYIEKINSFYSDIFLMGKTIYSCEYGAQIGTFEGKSDIRILFFPTSYFDMRMLLYRYGTFIYESDAEKTAHKIWEVLNKETIAVGLIDEELPGLFVDIQENPESSIEFLFKWSDGLIIAALEKLDQNKLSDEFAKQATNKSRFIDYFKENFSNISLVPKVKSLTVHVHCVAIRSDQGGSLFFAIERENVFKMDDGSLYRTPVSFIPLKEIDTDPKFISLAEQLTFQNYKSRGGELFRSGKRISAEQIKASFFVAPKNKLINTVCMKKIRRFQ